MKKYAILLANMFILPNISMASRGGHSAGYFVSSINTVYALHCLASGEELVAQRERECADVSTAIDMLMALTVPPVDLARMLEDGELSEAQFELALEAWTAHARLCIDIMRRWGYGVAIFVSAYQVASIETETRELVTYWRGQLHEQ